MYVWSRNERWHSWTFLAMFGFAPAHNPPLKSLSWTAHSPLSCWIASTSATHTCCASPACQVSQTHSPKWSLSDNLKGPLLTLYLYMLCFITRVIGIGRTKIKRLESSCLCLRFHGNRLSCWRRISSGHRGKA